MSVKPRSQVFAPEDPDIDEARLYEALRSMRNNNDYFLLHAEDLFEQCPRGWILIFGDNQVEMFDDIFEAAKRRTDLDQSDRDGSIVRHQRSGTWIL